MYAVHFFEKNNLVLSQLLNQVPIEGAAIKIKGRKGIVLSITEVDEKKYHVAVELEKVKKQAPVLTALDKKKKR
ncbi:hypothetical protein SAMN05880501_104102 [Ureibacillus xyleni]|uniref:Uncharacterized protein n=1 Tax=Ureibacillus xyleni TaxID=614648 RepID=A0A285SD58_9BACL|nr:hypothetical protein [Ureibacillus xyleni]SOC05725.1 hypothetical protein SAMN05880501_104102 [Ureibacillus xyleni]